MNDFDKWCKQNRIHHKLIPLAYIVYLIKKIFK